MSSTKKAVKAVKASKAVELDIAKAIDAVEAAKEAREYDSALALKRARLSGSALKAPTAIGLGVYPIENKENGTSVVLSALFTASGFRTKIGADLFGAGLSVLFSGKSPAIDKEVEKAISLYEKRSGRKYGNFSTLRSRILSEIRRGNITSFTLSENPAR